VLSTEVVALRDSNAFVEKKYGRLFVNPGSPTDKRWAERNTIGILEITSQDVSPKILEI
jgi:predicted phosphodiesterase